MLNPALREVYTEPMMKKLEEMAADLEPKGVKALVCYEDVYENGFACPGMIFIDLSDKDAGDLIYKYFNREWLYEQVGHGDGLMPIGCPLSDVSPETYGIELWL